MIKRLERNELRNFCDVKSIKKLMNKSKCDAKEDLDNLDIIGQKTAIETLKFGLSMKNKYYNIYVSGSNGVGKTTFSKKYVEDYAKLQKVPNDLVYVYNFENPLSPTAISFPAGEGKIFKRDIDELIKTLSVEMPKRFSSENYEDDREFIIKYYNSKKDMIIAEVTNYATSKGFGIKHTETGICFMPVIKGDMISDEEFENLPTAKKDKLTKELNELEERAFKVLKLLVGVDKKLKEELVSLEYNLSLLTVGYYINSLQATYKDDERVSSYLVNLREDILNNIDPFLDEIDEQDNNIFIIPQAPKKTYEELFYKYGVNLLVDNSEQEGAPVITTYNPSYSNLVGEIEFESDATNLITDYMKIKAGLFHKANGGYIILHIEDILKNPYSLETIIRVLKSGIVNIEPLKELQLNSVSISTIEPEQTSIDIKFIIIGSNYYHDILCEYDDSFSKYFKINCMFDYEMDNDEENIKNIVNFVSKIQNEYDTLNFEASALKELVEYTTRLSGKKDKITTNFSKIEEILIEANAWACGDGANSISDEYIKKSINKKIEFSNIYEKKLEDMIIKNDILINTSGFAVGEINGLAVLDYGNFCFGKPSKITATTYMGKTGVIDVEKEADLSGNIHTKGIQVITGYLGKTYGNNFPLSFSCKVCFEQNYSGVDGDSASSTELYAIISSLSGVPINQSLAVTGSVNQMGKIQPIGGVNEKIEGFFDICNKRGLTGEQGVMIPIQNVSDLSLNDEVIEAVSNNMFNIYAIDDINDGIELLTGEIAGELSENNDFEETSVHGKALSKLKLFHQRIVKS